MPAIVSDEDESWSDSVAKISDDISKASPAQQLAVGGIGGWVCGFSFCKVGKWAAIALGSSLIAMQIAYQRRWIKVNPSKFEKEVDNFKRKLSRELDPSRLPTSSQVGKFCRENVYLAGGFAGGFLLGMGSA